MASLTYYKYKKGATPNYSITGQSKLKLRDGDPATTGTGNILIDFSIIDGPEDIAVFDKSGNLLDYAFENPDYTGVVDVHLYGDWSSKEIYIAYGNGPSDNSVSLTAVNSQTSGLVGYWPFSEQSGDVAADVSGNNNDGTNNGATQGVAGRVGDAFDFDVSDDYVEIPDFDKFDGYTVTAWVKPNEVDSGEYDIIKIAKNNRFTLAIDHNSYPKKLVLWQDDGSTVKFVPSNNKISANQYYFVTAKWNGTEIELFIDGVSQGTKSASGMGAGDTGDVIGARYYGDYSLNFNGTIDEPMIFDRALSETEVEALHAATKADPDFWSQEAAEKTEATVTTNSATNITATTATLNGESTVDGDHYVYFQWRQVGETEWNTTEKQSVSGATTFSQEIDLPLIAGKTDFEFRAVVEQDGVTSVGDTLEFTSEYLAKGKLTGEAELLIPSSKGELLANSSEAELLTSSSKAELV